MAPHKIPDVLRYGLAVDIASHLNFGGNLRRDVACPMLERIEGDDADRIVELTRHEIANDRLQVNPLKFCFTVNVTAGEVPIHHKIDGLIRPVRDNGW
jgi:hypothetical protein